MVRTNVPKIFFLALSLGAVSIGAMLVQGGCTGNECAYDEQNQDVPVEGGLDCPPDQSCYIGQCFRQCNPGVERSEPCTTNDDCDDSARPNCVFLDSLAGSFCSTCDEGQTCVLGLNICQPVAEIPDPEIPSQMMSNVPLALDGGQIDATTFEDAGVDMPVATNPDFTGYISMFQVTDSVSRTPDTAVGDVSFCNVAGATQIIEDETLSGIDRCELIMLRRYVGTSTPANLGSIRWEEGNEGAMEASPIVAEYNDQLRDYTFDAMPARLFNYSTAPQSNHKFVFIEGGGLMNVLSPWTGVNDGLVLIPYETKPSAETLALLDDVPIEISLANPIDLRFAWEVLPPEVRGSELGNAMTVEIGGQRSPCDNDGSKAQQYVIRCQVNEGTPGVSPEITVAADLLREYAMLLDPIPGEQVPVRFGRVKSEAVLVFGPNVEPPALPTSSLINVYFGQEFHSVARFVQ